MDIMDMAEPGRGLGPGLGGASDSDIQLELESISILGFMSAKDDWCKLRFREAEAMEADSPMDEFNPNRCMCRGGP